MGAAFYPSLSARLLPLRRAESSRQRFGLMHFNLSRG